MVAWKRAGWGGCATSPAGAAMASLILLVAPSGGEERAWSSGPTVTRPLVLHRRTKTAIAIINSGIAPTEHPTISTMSVVVVLLGPLVGELGGGDGDASLTGGGDGGDGGERGRIVIEVMQ